MDLPRKYLLSNYSGNIVICWGPSNVAESEVLEKELKNSKVIKLTGKRKLDDLIPIISKSDLMISNQTSAPHMGSRFFQFYSQNMYVNVEYRC